MKKILTYFFPVFFCCIIANNSYSQNYAHISGYVQLPNGLPLSNNTVYLYSDSISPHLQEVSSDFAGYYQFDIPLNVSTTFLLYIFETPQLIIDTLLYYSGQTAEYKVDFVLNQNTNTFNCDARFNWELKTNTFSQVVFVPWVEQSSSSLIWHWSFGDGSYSDEINPMHQYSAPGSFEVCLTLSDSFHNCFKTFCDTVFLVGFPCSASYTYSNDSGNVSVSAIVTGSAYSFTWSSSDFLPPASLNFIHHFSSPGEYPLCIEVNDTFSGCQQIFCDTIIVPNHNNCISNFEYFISNIRDDVITLNFHSNSTGNIDRWFWSNNNDFVSETDYAQVTVSLNDTAVICLNVFNALENGYCNSTLCDTVSFNSLPMSCNANFISIKDSIDDFFVSFSPLNVTSYTNFLTRYHWYFGDGFESNNLYAQHQYRHSGSYTVTLKVILIDTLHGNIEVCNESASKIITLNDKTCNAEFVFEQQPESFSYSFTNISSGNITMHQWDFGDGNQSIEMNPNHTFSDTLEHLVCLMVWDTASCESSVCYSVKVLYDLPMCSAYFSTSSDGASCSPACVSFADYSSSNTNITHWLWSFGDGTQSSSQNPIHTYSEPGFYEVCLEISAQHFTGLQCSHVFCNDVTVEQFSKYNLGGQVFGGIYPVDNATAELYRINPNDEVEYLESTDYSYLGYYYFYQLPPGDYLVKTNLTKFSEQYYLGYIPTYTGNVIKWQNASVIELSSNFYDADIHLTLPQQTQGPCKINGQLVNSQIPQQHFSKEGIEILLMNASDIPYSFCYTDSSGKFSFNNINYGTYKIQAEITGKFTTPVWVTLSPQLSVDSALVPVPSSLMTSVNPEESFVTSLSLPYPNPANDFITIDFTAEQSLKIKTEIYNLLGILECSYAFSLDKGENNIVMPLSQLNQGVYFLKFSTEKGFVKKFIFLRR